jgi:hypothetical protein
MVFLDLSGLAHTVIFLEVFIVGSCLVSFGSNGLIPAELGALVDSTQERNLLVIPSGELTIVEIVCHSLVGADCFRDALCT